VMALLYRFAQLHDRSGTRVFSFVVTRTVVRDPERDVTSKELVCGFQRWAVAFSRGEKVIRSAISDHLLTTDTKLFRTHTKN